MRPQNAWTLSKPLAEASLVKCLSGLATRTPIFLARWKTVVGPINGNSMRLPKGSRSISSWTTEKERM